MQIYSQIHSTSFNGCSNVLVNIKTTTHCYYGKAVSVAVTSKQQLLSPDCTRNSLQKEHEQVQNQQVQHQHQSLLPESNNCNTALSAVKLQHYTPALPLQCPKAAVMVVIAVAVASQQHHFQDMFLHTSKLSYRTGGIPGTPGMFGFIGKPVIGEMPALDVVQNCETGTAATANSSNSEQHQATARTAPSNSKHD